MTEKMVTRESKWAMLLLAIYPILSMYGRLLNYAIWSFLLFVLYLGLNSKHGHLTLFPKFYKFYWGYLAIDYFIITRRMGALIPGGATFFLFSIILIFISRQFDLVYYKRYMRMILFVAIALFYAQEIMWYVTGSKFVPILPLGHLTTTLTYNEMISRNLVYRSASLFFEPAMFAVYLLLGLMIELGSPQGKRFLSGFAILIILTLLFLRSGTGIAGLGVLLLNKAGSYIKKLSSRKRFFATVLIIAFVGGAFMIYMRTEAGAEMIKRSQTELRFDEDGRSFARLAQGVFVYMDLPVVNKIIGASDEVLLPLASKYAGFDTVDKANILYMNGWSTVLTHTGLIGLVFLLAVLIQLYKNGNEISRAGIWLFAVLSLVSQTYCQSLMLIVLIIATYYQHQIITSSEHENTTYTVFYPRTVEVD